MLVPEVFCFLNVGRTRVLQNTVHNLYNEELSDLYSLPNVVRVVKSGRMRWAGHVARMGWGEVCTGFW